MFAEFDKYLKQHAGLCDADIELMWAMAIKRTMQRKELLLQEGEVCRYKGLVIKGVLRTYRTKEDGSEHIIQFAPENFWTIDPESYDMESPSRYNIDALENSEVLLWTKKSFEELRRSIPALKTFADKIIATNIYLNRQRIFSAISSTAEEKYDEFVRTHPDIFVRVPLHMVASYLGVSRETLSRIRNAQVRR